MHWAQILINTRKIGGNKKKKKQQEKEPLEAEKLNFLLQLHLALKILH